MSFTSGETTKQTRGHHPEHVENRLFINGQYVPSISGRKFTVSNPTTERPVASVYEAAAEDVDVAVQAAQAALPGWSALSATDRGGYLSKLADTIAQNIEELFYLEAITMGKPYIGDGLNTGFVLQTLRYFASKALDVSGDSSLNTADFVNITFRQPFGVCGAIIPWNVPLVMFVFKAGPALAAGNTLVLKTSEKSPLSVLAVGRLLQEVGLPKGVLNILSGGATCGDAIARHMLIRKVSFTGSTLVGREVKKAAAESNLKKVTLELGGKSPLIIFEDADLDRAVPAAAYSILANSGQACIASSRIYVHERVSEKFTMQLVKTMGEMVKAGDPLVESSGRGPQVDRIQFDRILSYLDEARRDGLSVVLGGNRLGTSGFFIEPTIIADAPEDARVMREEIFGPVVCVNKFAGDGQAEVLELANNTEFGLYASVYTRDLSRAMRVAKAFQAGSVGVNCTSPMMAVDVPFGGWKQSGDGRELSRYATDYWTELKSVFIAL